MPHPTSIARGLFATAALTGCSSTPRTPAPIDHAEVTAQPAVYAALFEADRTWDYQVDRSVAGAAAGSARVACRVAELGERASHRWSRIECDAAIHDAAGPHPDPVAGVWVATSNELYWFDALPTDGSALELGLGGIVIDEAPVAFVEPLMVSEHGGETVVERAIEARGPLWCETRWDHFGAPTSHARCFGADGIVEGDQRWQADDDSEHATRYALVRGSP